MDGPGQPLGTTFALRSGISLEWWEMRRVNGSQRPE
jgi:hypothetical protein